MVTGHLSGFILLPERTYLDFGFDNFLRKRFLFGAVMICLPLVFLLIAEGVLRLCGFGGYDPVFRNAGPVAGPALRRQRSRKCERSRCMGRSRGGLTTKIHALVDALGLPIGLKLTEGQAHDGRSAADMLDGLGKGEVLLGDRAYDTDALRAWCAEHGVEAVIPSKRNRKVPIPHDRVRYRTRHRIENLFGRVKDYTRITLRKDKTSRSYAGFVSLAFALINIQLCP